MPNSSGAAGHGIRSGLGALFASWIGLVGVVCVSKGSVARVDVSCRVSGIFAAMGTGMLLVILSG